MPEQHRNPAIEYSDAIERLCRPHLAAITGPGGEHMGTRLEAPLLQTLARNVGAGVMRGGGAGEQAHARTPLNVGAADLLEAIRHRALRWYVEGPGARDARPDVIPALIEVRLATMNAWRAKRISTSTLNGRTRQLNGWAQAITDLLDPPMRIELTDPCPRCGERWVTPDTPEADSTPALSTTYRSVQTAHTQCAYCGATWLGIDGARRLRIELDAAARMRRLLLGAA